MSRSPSIEETRGPRVGVSNERAHETQWQPRRALEGARAPFVVDADFGTERLNFQKRDSGGVKQLWPNSNEGTRWNISETYDGKMWGKLVDTDNKET